MTLRLREPSGGTVVRSALVASTGTGSWEQLVVTSAGAAGGTSLEGSRRRRVAEAELVSLQYRSAIASAEELREMADYVHGYGTREQERLVEQAEHWRHRLIADGTTLPAGTRLLEVGCGVGAVLAVLGQEFPGARLTGVDIEPKQLAYARGHLERAGVVAALVEADAGALPFDDESFDHVWMMWFLEHVPDPIAVLSEARRVLASDGAITAIEVDYSTARAQPSSSALEALFGAMVEGMAAAGWSDAGTRLPGWLREAGFNHVDPGERRFWWQDDDLVGEASYAADVLESALPSLAQLPGRTEGELRAGLEHLRGLPSHSGAGLGWVVHKSTGRNAR